MRPWPKCLRHFPLAEILFTVGVCLLLLAEFALLRGLLLWRNYSQAAETPSALLAGSFLVGLRFDLAISCYLLIPFFLLLMLLRRRGRMMAIGVFSVLASGILLLGIAEAEFYRELEMRFNTLVFEYLSHPDIVGGMIWDGYPVLRYLLLWGALSLLFAAGIRSLYRRLLAPPAGEQRQLLCRTLGTTAMLALMIVAARGGFAGEPLRWGDAFFSTDPFANHLALNGFYTLGRSSMEKFYGSKAFWTRAQPPAAARETTRRMLLLGDEEDLGSTDYPLLRQRREGAPPLLETAAGEPVNVVVILMESFSARHVGALGATPSLTPEFDRLCREGVLFERAFSNGTHTHQGVFASLASFPNLPGFEYLMKTMEANQEFSGLPTLLGRKGYQSVFLYNGLFSWDNKEGFFRQHGIDRFIGTGDYVNPTFVDPVWGVSDHDVFQRANEEFRDMARKGPFLAAILTLSNHSPFNLPDPLPFERLEGEGELGGRYNAMRYADWALGEFFRQARKEAYFHNTLFVLTGDHGFGVPPAITNLNLERFHVPLLFYAPELLKDPGSRRRTVASQVDIGATVLALLGIDMPHQSWGRNLFSPALQDAGFAVIKPSGGDATSALVEGDYILIQEPKEKPQLFRYSLAFPPAAEPRVDEPERTAAMRDRLHAYIEAGILNLRERRVGLPESPVAAQHH